VARIGGSVEAGSAALFTRFRATFSLGIPADGHAYEHLFEVF
jgi:hypothetical protein